MKPWYRSKTVWVSILTSLSGLLAFLMGEDVISQHPQVVAVLTTMVGSVHLVLRLLTTQGIGAAHDSTDD